jgi:N-acetylmuramoyl-L-alanine amidase
MTLVPRFEQRPSPNHGERASGAMIDMIVLHYTGMPEAERALRWLCDPESAVSSHYFVYEDGLIAQLVDEERRAWHAGQSLWDGETDINSHSIGIEISNPGHEFGYLPFPEGQIDAVIALCRDILTRRAIPARRILAHSDVAPLRKSDPGELFPWDRLHREGIGVWVSPEPPAEEVVSQIGDKGGAVSELKRKLRAYGYGVDPGPEFTAETAAVVTAFQRHFRPVRVDGVADPSSVATLEKLIATVA